MAYADEMARAQRGMHNELPVQERLTELRAEVQDLQQPAAFKIGDGVATTVGAAVGGKLAFDWIQGHACTMPKMNKVGAVFFASAVAGAGLYALSKGLERRYIEARIGDAKDEMIIAQNDAILDRLPSFAERELIRKEQSSTIERS